MQVDTAGWTGDGSFTAALLEALQSVAAIDAVKVEDAPASRADAGYSLIANDVYVRFRIDTRKEPVTRFGFLPGSRRVNVPAMTLAGLGETLAAVEGIGAPDYGDEGMLQYLRTERIVPPYQTRGIKVVELVRIYDLGTPPRG